MKVSFCPIDSRSSKFTNLTISISDYKCVKHLGQYVGKYRRKYNDLYEQKTARAAQLQALKNNKFNLDSSIRTIPSVNAIKCKRYNYRQNLRLSNEPFDALIKMQQQEAILDQQQSLPLHHRGLIHNVQKIPFQVTLYNCQSVIMLNQASKSDFPGVFCDSVNKQCQSINGKDVDMSSMVIHNPASMETFPIIQHISTDKGDIGWRNAFFRYNIFMFEFDFMCI